MNKLGDPASSAKLAALRARFARIVPATWSVKPFLRSAGVELPEVFRFHLCVSLQRRKRNAPKRPNETPITGLSNTNQIEKPHAAMELRCGFMIIISFSSLLLCE
jgi:hypothetical protein